MDKLSLFSASPARVVCSSFTTAGERNTGPVLDGRSDMCWTAAERKSKASPCGKYEAMIAIRYVYMRLLEHAKCVTPIRCWRLEMNSFPGHSHSS